MTLGGASVGDHDLVQEVLGQEGMDLAFWRIAMRPGKTIDGRPSWKNQGARSSRQSCLQPGMRVIVPETASSRPCWANRASAPDRNMQFSVQNCRENDRRQDYVRGNAERRSQRRLDCHTVHKTGQLHAWPTGTVRRVDHPSATCASPRSRDIRSGPHSLIEKQRGSAFAQGVGDLIGDRLEQIAQDCALFGFQERFHGHARDQRLSAEFIQLFIINDQAGLRS